MNDGATERLARLDTEAGRIGDRIDEAIKAGNEDEVDRLLGLLAACDAKRMPLQRERTGYTAQPEPAPTEGTGDLWAEVIADWAKKWTGSSGRIRTAMHQRRQFGIDKYGTPLQRDNGRDALTDARDEALDLRVYAQQLETENAGRVIDLADALLLELFKGASARGGLAR